MQVQQNFQSLTGGLDFYTLTFVGSVMAEGKYDINTMLTDGSAEAIAAEKAANLAIVLNTISLKAQPVIQSLDSTGLIVKVAVEHKNAWKNDEDLKTAFATVKLFDAAGTGNKITASVTVVKSEIL